MIMSVIIIVSSFGSVFAAEEASIEVCRLNVSMGSCSQVWDDGSIHPDEVVLIKMANKSDVVADLGFIVYGQGSTVYVVAEGVEPGEMVQVPWDPSWPTLDPNGTLTLKKMVKSSGGNWQNKGGTHVVHGYYAGIEVGNLCYVEKPPTSEPKPCELNPTCTTITVGEGIPVVEWKAPPAGHMYIIYTMATECVPNIDDCCWEPGVRLRTAIASEPFKFRAYAIIGGQLRLYVYESEFDEEMQMYVAGLPVDQTVVLLNEDAPSGLWDWSNWEESLRWRYNGNTVQKITSASGWGIQFIQLIQHVE